MNNGTLYAPRHEEAFSPKGKKRPKPLRSLGLALLLVERHIWLEVAAYMQQAVCVQTLKKKTEKKREKIRPTQNTPRNPQQPGDRVQLETAF